VNARCDEGDMTAVDVLIVGAGISGISAAWHLQRACPDHSFAMIEARADLGGTWDLFRYPGIRCDSDMFTLGYRFAPWPNPQSIAEAGPIKDYLRSTATQYGIAQRIEYGQRLVSAAWSTPSARWTLTVEDTRSGATHTRYCRFLFLCGGYYRYEHGYQPDFPGLADFPGPVIHPQHWPADLDYAGKRVVIIGSGATAVTMLPAMAQRAARVTLLQRTPSYLIVQPSRDAMVARLRRVLPERVVYPLVRWRNLSLHLLLFWLCRRFPQQARRLLLRRVQRELPGVDVEKHFTPPYNPWEQRLCLVPDSDFFRALRSGHAEVVTDHIERFTADGIVLASGALLPADIVVSATGLQLQVLGGVQVTVDGCAVDPAQTVTYKGAMFSDVPNLVSTFGYTNASWTLKADLVSVYVCRVLRRMRLRDSRWVVPRLRDLAMPRTDWTDFSSGYFARARAILPKQGLQAPWRLHQNYFRDLVAMRYSALDDGALVFEGREPADAPEPDDRDALSHKSAHDLRT